jgi:hypothetical protein
MPSLSLKASINCPIIGGSSGSPYDPDAFAWFNAVEATGANFGASPESISSNKNAFNTAFLSLKSDGIWSAIRQACFLVGPSTIAGALVNIKLTGNPVNNNFTSEFYDKLTGLSGMIPDSVSNTNRYLDTLLNDSTDINGLDFHMCVAATNSFTIPLGGTEAIFGSNNDGAQTGGDIFISESEGGLILSPNSYESYGFSGPELCFSRLDGDVTFPRAVFGWGTYPIDYADYFSGNNFLLFKTIGNISVNNLLYDGKISFYSIGTSTNVEAMIGIINQLKNSLVS